MYFHSKQLIYRVITLILEFSGILLKGKYQVQKKYLI